MGMLREVKSGCVSLEVMLVGHRRCYSILHDPNICFSIKPMAASSCSSRTSLFRNPGWLAHRISERLVTLETTFHSQQEAPAVTHARSLPGQGGAARWGQMTGVKAATDWLRLQHTAAADRTKFDACATLVPGQPSANSRCRATFTII